MYLEDTILTAFEDMVRERDHYPYDISNETLNKVESIVKEALEN